MTRNAIPGLKCDVFSIDRQNYFDWLVIQLHSKRTGQSQPFNNKRQRDVAYQD